VDSVGIALTQPSCAFVIKLYTKSSVSTLAYADANCPGDTGSNSGLSRKRLLSYVGLTAG